MGASVGKPKLWRDFRTEFRGRLAGITLRLFCPSSHFTVPAIKAEDRPARIFEFPAMDGFVSRQMPACGRHTLCTTRVHKPRRFPNRATGRRLRS